VLTINIFSQKKHWIDPELTMIQNTLNDCIEALIMASTRK